MFISFSGFKWFGSLTNLRRKSDSQKDEPLAKGVSEDDMSIHPRSSSYASSSEMYTHMGTMPRHPKKEKSLKKSKSKDKTDLSRSQSMRPIQDHVVESPLLSVLSGKGLEVLDKPIVEGKPTIETKDAHIQNRSLPSPPTLDGLAKEQVTGDEEPTIDSSQSDLLPEPSGDAPPGVCLTKELIPALPVKRQKADISMKNTVELQSDSTSVHLPLKIDNKVEEKKSNWEDANKASGYKEENQEPNR